jgi:hypothetical protein
MIGSYGACPCDKLAGTTQAHPVPVRTRGQVHVSLSRHALGEKVAWEGGAFEALRYGIRSREIDDPELAQLWSRMESLYEQIAPLAWRIELILDKAA